MSERIPSDASLAALETPVPLVDLDRLARNLERMAVYAAEHRLALRPHVKTHKSPEVAAAQLRLGAAGLTCATPRELEVMSAVGGDLLLAYPPVGAPKLARLFALPPEVRVTVALDSAEAVETLAAAARAAGREVGVYVELDLGMRRVGVSAVEDAVALARLVGERAPLVWRGINFYPGHVRAPVHEQEAALAEVRASVARAREALERAGLPPAVVSGGSTPTVWRSHETGVDEIRPGTYVYNDRTTAAVGACAWDDCALTVLATVVSTAVPGQAVVDAGTKALGREPMRGVAGPSAEGYGALLDRPEVAVTALSEEHGTLDLRHGGWRPAVGEQVRIVPNHVCIAVHLFDRVVGVREGRVEGGWAVAARGR
jgi:D-serine deaminase-like pyridoxal phosphate-dependent protein